MTVNCQNIGESVTSSTGASTGTPVTSSTPLQTFINDGDITALTSTARSDTIGHIMAITWPIEVANFHEQ